MSRNVDINSDMGESPAMIADGTQEALMAFVTSANIACGGHAGDPETMRVTVKQARRYGVAVGAHPGYPDRENFGRLPVVMALEEVENTVEAQIRTLAAVAGEITHVKPHGALYNQAVHNRELARAIARGIARFDQNLLVMGLAGSPMLEVFREERLRAAAEAFADRRYEADGTLRNRKYADALITDPLEAAQQARRFASERSIDTICIHSDTPGALEIARAVFAAVGTKATKRGKV